MRAVQKTSRLYLTTSRAASSFESDDDDDDDDDESSAQHRPIAKIVTIGINHPPYSTYTWIFNFRPTVIPEILFDDKKRYWLHQ